MRDRLLSQAIGFGVAGWLLSLASGACAGIPTLVEFPLVLSPTAVLAFAIALRGFQGPRDPAKRWPRRIVLLLAGAIINGTAVYSGFLGHSHDPGIGLLLASFAAGLAPAGALWLANNESPWIGWVACACVPLPTCSFVAALGMPYGMRF